MPLYDFRCPTCDHEGETFVPLRDYEVEGLICPRCSNKAKTIISPVRTIGPMPSKPLDMPQIGRSFTSNRELKNYLAQNKGSQLIHRDSSEWKDHRHHVRTVAENQAKREGYQGLDQKRDTLRKDRKRKAELATGIDSPRVFK
tara:strand:- start:460 stop:888 length:429 start_codon:yes stop_codon:yes gene_type:complete